MSLPVAHPEVVRAAEDLAPLVAAGAEEIEATGRLPEPIVEGMTAAGLYDLFRPATSGGTEVDPISAFFAIEALARADGSAAWCAHVSSASSYSLGALAPGTVGDARRFAGSNRPLGEARRVEGGFVVDGRWDFASNSLHADWYFPTCTSEEAGRRRLRSVSIPIAEVEILDTWQVAGLRGTGSNDVVVRQVFVPDAHMPARRHLTAAQQASPLYSPRLTMVVNWVLTAAVSLGIARGALDTFSGLSTLGTAHGVDLPLRERPEVQGTVGRAAAMLGAARAYCVYALADAWAVAVEAWEEARGGHDHGHDHGDGHDHDHGDGHDHGSGDSGTARLDRQLDALVPEARMAIPHAMRTAVEVVDLLFHAGGTRAVYEKGGLERRFRDVHVAAQHFAGSPSHLAAGGRLAMGLPAGAPFW